MSKKKHKIYPFISDHYDAGVNHPVVKYSGYMGLLCPKCYKDILIKGHVKFNAIPVEEKNRYDYELNLYIQEFIGVTCPECGKLFFADSFIDVNILPILSVLNKKGYITEYSCEGHPSKATISELSTAYVRFKYYDQHDILEAYPLPAPWEDTTYEDAYFDHARNKIIYPFTIRCKDNNATIRTRMASLRRWANSLPKWDEYNK